MKPEMKAATEAALRRAAELDAKRPRAGAIDCDARPLQERRRWHVVHVAAKMEGLQSLAAEQLLAAGFEIYAPLLRRMVLPKSNALSRAQRSLRHMFVREKIEPMFPRYEFLRFDPLVDPWQGIFRMVGVHGMYCSNNQPVAIPDDWIARLRGREVNGAVPGELTADEVFEFSKGDRVRVTLSRWAGLTGTIERLDANGRIRLLLDFLGGAAADLTVDQIEKA
jgi:transcription antitermination factor NusG